MRKMDTKKLIIGCAVILSFLMMVSLAFGNDLRPRYIPQKPAVAVIPQGYSHHLIDVKFVDGLDIGLSEKYQPTDRSGSALSSREAADVLRQIADAGGKWLRMSGENEIKADDMREVAQKNLGEELADLNNYFILNVPEGRSAEQWLNRLNSLAEIELAKPMPMAVAPPVSNYESLQGYLNPATDGIDAKYAWTVPGGAGSSVTVCDLEYSWNLSHDDLPINIATWIMIPYTAQDPFNDDNHGTAVLGELVSLNNSWGTTGANYGSYMTVAPTFLKPPVGDSGWYLSVAMTNASYNLGVGDVMLIEHQMAGPNWSASTGDTGLVPVEWDLTIYNLVKTIVGNGVYVVEAAGNGYQDLDNAIYNTGHAPFYRTNHSGAIIVGAGAVPSYFGGSTTDRSRLSFSNYGTRVDLQGWGEAVVTTGYGDLDSTEGYDRKYTNSFAGTSSASPNIASAVAILSSIDETYNTFMNRMLDPARMIHLLRFTGSEQQGGIHPPWEIIGTRPDVRSAIMISGITDTVYKKPGYVDYCPKGMPDFCMYLDSSWTGYGRWTYDGPVALANCFWWFDSKFEPYPIDPRPFYPGGGTVGDSFSLVTSYGAWDDHDTNNVKPLIEALAACMTTDDTVTVPGIYEYGTWYFEFENCINTWLISAGLRGNFTDTMVNLPGFDYLADQLTDNQNVILLLGFYVADSADPSGFNCRRIGGHYVNMAGVNSTTNRIAIADAYMPYQTSYYYKNIGTYVDAGDIDYDYYQIGNVDSSMCERIAGGLKLDDYPSYAHSSFENINGPSEGFPGGSVLNYYTVIEYAYVICPTEEPPLDTCTYYKPSYDDYAPNSVPDFDQKQKASWISPYTGMYSYCGPAALANCMWWYDSKLEPSPVDPRPFYPGPGNPAANDGYPLVTSYGAWDDHDTNNVSPLILQLKALAKTDGPYPGTYIQDMKTAFDSMTVLAGIDTEFVSTLVAGPDYDLIADSVLASNNVILLLGFYEPTNPAGCVRLGGHYVTAAGVCTDDNAVCISDPYFNKNENEPPAGASHGSTVHNDAYYVSGPHDTHHHDKYLTAPYSHTCSTQAVTQLINYPSNWSDLVNFASQNWHSVTVPPGPYTGGPIVTLVDYAMVITYIPPGGPCDCQPGYCNGDALLNIFDITYLISYLYLGGPAPVPYTLCSGDPNCDCTTNIFDVTYLISYLYISGPPPCSCTDWLTACGPPLRK